MVNGRPVTDNAAQIMKAIRSRLLQPRRAFSFQVGGVELIPQAITGNSGTVDAKNGPHPRSCSIHQFTNLLYLVTWRVEAHYWENNNVLPNNNPIVSNLPGNMVLYNRWRETQRIDNRNFSTRTRSGKMIIRSDNQEGQTADTVREQMAVVGVPRGFLRDSSMYTVSEDGLGVEYTVVDREVYRYPPPPAMTAEGTYSESSNNYGAFRIGHVSLTLRGSPDTPQIDLVSIAVSVAMIKMRSRGVRLQNQNDPDNNVPLLNRSAVRVGMYDNWVQVEVEGMLSQTKNIGKGVAGWDDWRKDNYYLTATPFSEDYDNQPSYPVRGSSANLFLQAAAYYDPNLRNNEVDEASGQLNNGLEVGVAGKTREP